MTKHKPAANSDLYTASEVRQRYARTGAALAVPIMTMFWLDVWSDREQHPPTTPVFVGGTLLEAGCVALAASAKPKTSVGICLLAIPTSALLGRALVPVVRWLGRLSA